MIKFYYGPENEVLEIYRVLPAPQVTINTRLDYANDSIIGYTYVININGIASTYTQTQIQGLQNGQVYDMCTGDNLMTENEQILFGEGDTIVYTLPPDQNLTGLLGRIETLKAIFLRNGSSLTIRDDQNNNLLKAKGGILRSISFDQSTNNWVHTCPYSVEIEFNELELLNESFGCNNPFINDNPGLIDTSKYHIKSFNDKWSFDISEDYNNFVYESGKLIPVDADTFTVTGLNIWNPAIKLSYNISAVGKHYFDADGPGPNEKVVPGWIQAKNFAQEKLYNQVNSLAGLLRITNTRCDVDQLLKLNNLYKNDSDSPVPVGTGLIANLVDSTLADPYRVYDEIISCSVSESEGSFSLDYSCILKRDTSYTPFSAGNVKHTCNKTISTSYEGKKKIVNISIDGQVEGLTLGGLILGTFRNIKFNKNGSLFSKNLFATKFTNANDFLSSILNPTYTDLKDNFKDALQINSTGLGLSDITTCSSSIKPIKFNLTKDFTNGTISYNAEYSSINSCIKELDGGTIFNTQITIDEPLPVLAELQVPNGNYIIQDIGTVTAKKISISSEGKKSNQDCCENGISSFIGSAINQNIEQLFPFITLPNPNLYILTTKNLNYDPLMSSYSINLSYICNSGCSI